MTLKLSIVGTVLTVHDFKQEKMDACNKKAIKDIWLSVGSHELRKNWRTIKANFYDDVRRSLFFFPSWREWQAVIV